MPFKQLLLVGLSALMPVTVLALGRGLDPALKPVVNPRSGLATEVWKLAGKVSGAASAVQIAPGWILSAKHATPPVGSQFKNTFGVSTVSACSPLAASDLVLCRMASNIPVPAGFRFPELVEDPSSLVGGQINMLPSLAAKLGGFLTVGHGDPAYGSTRYAWSDLLSFSIDEGNRPSVLGIAGPSPYADEGDSGSPVFWFPDGSTRVGLIGVMGSGSPVGPFRLSGHGYGFSNSVNPQISAQPVPSVETPVRLLSQALLNSIATQVNADGQSALLTSPASSFVGAVQPSPMWLGRGVLKVSASTPTAVQLNWSGASVGASVQSFTAFVQQPDGQAVSLRSVRGDSRSVALSGMSIGIPYVACVLPIGAQGIAPMGSASYSVNVGNSDAHWDFSASCLPLKFAAAPTAVLGFTVKLADRKYPVGTYKTETLSWGRPVSPALPDEIRYRLIVTINGVVDSQVELIEKTFWQGPIRLTPGEKICATITPISSPQTMGPRSPEQCVVVQ